MVVELFGMGELACTIVSSRHSSNLRTTAMKSQLDKIQAPSTRVRKSLKSLAAVCWRIASVCRGS